MATTLAPEACASREPGEEPGPGSWFLVSGDGWYVNLSSPNMTLDELAAFSNKLEPRDGEAANGFDHSGSGYRLTVESDQPEQWGEAVTSTWRRNGFDVALSIWMVDDASYLSRVVTGVAGGVMTPLDDHRYLITYPDQARISVYDDEGGYEVEPINEPFVDPYSVFLSEAD